MTSTKLFKKADNIDSQHRFVANPVKVFCRLRPLNSTCDKYGVYIKDFTTVVLSSQGNPQVPQKPNSLKQEIHFGFKQVFDSCATQADIFNLVAYPLIERLVRGQNSLLFTYGVTGSGKTYTMTGDTTQCGIMPRCLATLFRSIGSRHAAKCTFQSDHLNGFEIATATEMEIKRRQLTTKAQRTPLSTPRAQLQSLRRKNSELEFQQKNLVSPIVVMGVKAQCVYAVFISYIEIYNNTVYDLLEEGAVHKILESRIVREDANQNMYVHGATELEIKSVSEAMEAFQLGQKRKRMGQTMLNSESSRGHAVFNIRLVQAGITGQTGVTVSQLSLVDLAGSERSSRTKNAGARLREAGNINNSLMTLRTCLQYLRENQQAPMGTIPKQVPYRDSKITQLFKNFFQGEGQVSMIVCINPRLEDFMENAQVLKFAEMTQEVQIVNPRSGITMRKYANKENTVLKERNHTNIELRTQLAKNFDYERRLDLYRKRVLELEAQNSELRKEVEQLRKDQKSFTSGSYKTVSVKAAVIEQPACKPQIQPMFAHNTGKTGERVYENELKKKLLERREKLEKFEQNQIEPKKRRFSTTTDTTSSSDYEYEKISKDLKLSLCRQQSFSIKSANNFTPICSTKYLNARQSISAAPILQKTLQYRNSIDINKTIVDENSTSTPKKRPTFQCSTPSNCARKSLKFDTPSSAASLKLPTYQKDTSFDKREEALSVKIARHRKQLIENKRVNELLQSFKRTKSSASLITYREFDRNEESNQRRRSHSVGKGATHRSRS